MNPNSGGAIEARSHEAPGDKKLFNGQGDVETATVDAHSEEAVLSDERDIATHVISMEDDITLNPWTFRAFFLGISLSTFGGVLGELL
jgi:hypothetical protein